jgi:hypothetical protein
VSAPLFVPGELRLPSLNEYNNGLGYMILIRTE